MASTGVWFHTRYMRTGSPETPSSETLIDLQIGRTRNSSQKAIENYRKANPNLVSRIAFTKAPAPELPSKIKAQQDANRVDIDMILTGTDALAAGLDQNLWIDILTAYKSQLPNLDDIYQDGARKM